jgi:hypothetical protein
MHEIDNMLGHEISLRLIELGSVVEGLSIAVLVLVREVAAVVVTSKVASIRPFPP